MKMGPASATALRGTLFATNENASAVMMAMRLGMAVSCWTSVALDSGKASMIKAIDGVMPKADMAKSVSEKMPIFAFVSFDIMRPFVQGFMGDAHVSDCMVRNRWDHFRLSA